MFSIIIILYYSDQKLNIEQGHVNIRWECECRWRSIQMCCITPGPAPPPPRCPALAERGRAQLPSRGHGDTATRPAPGDLHSRDTATTDHGHLYCVNGDLYCVNFCERHIPRERCHWSDNPVRDIKISCISSSQFPGQTSTNTSTKLHTLIGDSSGQ